VPRDATGSDATTPKPIEAAALKPAGPAKPAATPATKPVEAAASKPTEASPPKPTDAGAAKPVEATANRPVDATTSRPTPTVAAKPPAAGEEPGIAARRPGATPTRADEGGQDRLAAVPAVPESRAPASGGEVLGAVGASRVTLIAKVDSWVQIRGTNSELLLTRVLRAGDKYHVPNRTGLTLMTGNAGAIEIAVDGKSLPPLGPVGEVRRDISLDPDELLKGGAAN
jgi:cytoskeleton protein RodZ